MGMLNVSLGLDTEKANLWKNGEFIIHGMNTHGGEPTADLVGDYQTFSNIEAGPGTVMYELLYTHYFNKFSLSAGMHDLNGEFTVTDYGLTFANSSFGITPVGSGTVPVSIFPVITLGVVARYEISDNIKWLGAIYDGDPGDYETNKHSMQWTVNYEEGVLLVSEVQFSNSSESHPGIYRLGGMFHNGLFSNIVDGADVRFNHNWYVMADQMVMPKNDNPDQGLGLFLQVSGAPKQLNFNNFYLGFGLNYMAPFTSRPDDVIGLGIAKANISPEMNKIALPGENYTSETAIELIYKFQFGDHFALMPEFQYIVNPGANALLDNALVGMLRFELAY